MYPLSITSSAMNFSRWCLGACIPPVPLFSVTWVIHSACFSGVGLNGIDRNKIDALSAMGSDAVTRQGARRDTLKRATPSARCTLSRCMTSAREHCGKSRRTVSSGWIRCKRPAPRACPGPPYCVQPPLVAARQPLHQRQLQQQSARHRLCTMEHGQTVQFSP